ncbi:MAG TPA: SBBP repeat-containing protein [Candidatus Deferrimicrobium sp.]|nr:SBBP repeat-containing protein [Candidatus Deferrimicrobium sp.]
MRNSTRNSKLILLIPFLALLFISPMILATHLSMGQLPQSHENIPGTLQSTTSHYFSWEVKYGYMNGDDEAGTGVAVSNDGFIYVVEEEGTLLKYFPNSTKVWEISWYPYMLNYFEAVATDDLGNIYCAVSIYDGADWKMGIVKFFPNGTLHWERLLSMTADQYANKLAIDKSTGDIFCIGSDSSNNDIIIYKVYVNGTEAWSKMWSSSEYDEGNDIAVDSSGNIYGVGTTNLAGDYDLLLFKMWANGTIAWNATWDSSAEEFGRGIVLDADGAIYCSGDSSGFGVDTDIVLVKFYANGTKAWNQSYDLNGVDDDSAVGLVMDSSGALYCTGESGYDIILVAFHPNGTGAWYFNWDYGSDDEDYGYGIAISANSSIYIAGVGYEENDDYEDAIILKYSLKLPAPAVLDSITPALDPDGIVTLTWDAVDLATVYYIYRSMSKISGVYGLNPEASTNTTTYIDYLSANGKYYYVVVAGNVAGNSSISNCENVTVGIPLTTPTLQPITPNVLGLLIIDWDTIPEAAFYYVFRSTSEITDVTGMTPIAVRSDSDFTETLTDGTYYYAVVAGDGFANSSESNCEYVTVSTSGGTCEGGCCTLLLVLLIPLIGAVLALVLLYRRKGIPT